MSVKKSNTTSFKPKMQRKRNKKLPVIDARLKISGVTDARLKILQNKKRLGLKSTHRSPLVMSKSNIMDARLKIEAHKQKVLLFSVFSCLGTLELFVKFPIPTETYQTGATKS